MESRRKPIAGDELAATKPSTKPPTKSAATRTSTKARPADTKAATRSAETKEATKPATKREATKPPVIKPSAAKSPTTKPPATQSMAIKSPAIRPAAAQPVATNSSATKPAVTKSLATKLLATHPVATKSPAIRSAATQPVATKPSATQPPATKPVAIQAATKPSAKPATKPTAGSCLMEQALSLLKDSQKITTDETTEKFNNLIRHVRTTCSKCPKNSTYMVIGAYYYELFKGRLGRYKSKLIDKDLAVMSEQSNEVGKERNWDNEKVKHCATFANLINLDTQKKLLEYPIKTVEIWRKLLDVKEELNPQLIGQLDLFEILKSCYYIFSLYGAPKYIKLTCMIYSELVLVHGQALKHHLLFAYYCQIRYCLDYGLLKKARSYLKTSQGLIKGIPKTHAKFIVNETYLIRIAECELRLLSDEDVQQAANDLKELIKEEHVNGVFVVSGYIRCLAWSLLTKFSAKQFPSQDLAHCFNESLLFIKSLIGMWYPFLFRIQAPNDQQANGQPCNGQPANGQQANDKQANDNQANDEQAKDKQANDNQETDKQVNDKQANNNQANDKQTNDQQAIDKQVKILSPIWLEFAFIKFILEFMMTYHCHAIHNSVTDSHFYFNIIMIRLSRIYGSLLWLSRHLLLSIHYEKPEVQKVKINQVKNLFVKQNESNKIPSTSNPVRNSTPTRKPLTTNTAANMPGTPGSERLVLQDDCLERAWKEPANCSHQDDTPIYLLKKSLLKNPILNHDDEIEVLTSCDYEKELVSLDNYPIPDLIVVRQELLLLLYLINESKSSFVHYFKQLDLEILNAVYFENLSAALKVDFDSLNRNHPNLITSQFNMRCLLIYLANFELEPSATVDLCRNVLKKAGNLGHSYEIHCFIAELVLCYVESLLREISDGRLNIPEYDFLECEKFLAQRPVYESNSPVRKRANPRSRVKPSAPKKACQYKMEEVRDYIQEMYDLDCAEVRPKKSAVKLNFTESDEKEGDAEKDKENLKRKLSKLKKERPSGSQEKTVDRRTGEKLADRGAGDAMEGRSQKVIGKSQQTFTVRKESKLNVAFSNDLSDLNNLSYRIGKLGFDETAEQEVHEYLIDESTDDFYGEFRRLLYHVLDLFGTHPPIKHYNLINALLFRLSTCKESPFGTEAAYYFSEVCQANALRYQTIQHIQKKSKHVSIKYDTRMLAFTPSGQTDCKKDELNRMIEIFPSNWRVLQIQFLKGAGSQSDLYLARYQRGHSPVLLKINVNSEKLCQNFTEEFNEIIQLSDKTVNEKESKVFWRMRYALDERLKRLMCDVNSTWINCFIGMFLGECSDVTCQKLFRQIESHLMCYAKTNHLVCVSPELLRVICESFIHLKEESFNHAMVSLFEPKNLFEDVYDECLNLVKKCFKFSTLEELREKISKKISFGPLALITGATLENFPFESLSYLRTLTQETFRVPSVRFLNWMYVNLRKTNQRVKQGVSDRDVYYLINPSQNLAYTEERFKGRFEELKKRKSCNWDGLVGQIPPEKELQRVLQDKDIYIYLGHNSGSRYLGRLNESVVNCLSLVMGCSSAALSNTDQMVEAFGSSYYFLMNGCPTYVGCLWNVTDRDIDRFSELLLKKTFKIYDSNENDVPKCASITKAVPQSRDICKLKYLNGAAPVVRGLPISMRLTENCES